MRNHKIGVLVLSLFFVLTTLNLRGQNCYENLVVFKTDSMTLDSFQLRCLDYHIKVFKTFKKYDPTSKLKLVVHTCENDLLKNSSIGSKRLEILSSCLVTSYSINALDLESMDKSNTVRIGFCNNYGGIIEFVITMTKPLSKKLTKEIKAIKL